MRPKYRIAAKEVNVMDRVEVAPTALRQDPRPPYTQVSITTEVGTDFVAHTQWFGGAMDEFDDRTLADFVGSGLLGQ